MGEFRKKVGLALGSGGARGFCHLGVLQVFEENNIPIDYISGCSIGAIAGACYASGANLKDMRDLVSTLTQYIVMDINISYKKCGLIKGQRVVNTLRPLLGDKTFEDCTIPFRATATDIKHDVLKTFDSGLLIDAIRASMSIPVAFQAVELGNSIYVDGGVLERIPIQACRDMGADVVIAVDALGEPIKEYETGGIINMIERAYLLMDWESSKTKILQADLLITPEQGDRSIYIFKDNEYSIEQGRIAAEKMLPQILKLIQ